MSDKLWPNIYVALDFKDRLILTETLIFLRKLQKTMDDNHFYRSEIDGIIVAFETVILKIENDQ